MKKDHVWYVSYSSNIEPDEQFAPPRPARATRRFKTESEAKEFAKEVIQDGWSAIAGTMNPYLPKKVIASKHILDWIASDS